MKKLAILVSLVVATPVFACPMHDKEEAAKTAENDKAKAPAKEAPKAEAPKQEKKEETKPAATAKAKEQPKKDAPATKPTKVSQK